MPDKKIKELHNAISVYEGTIKISPLVHKEYIAYHETIDLDKYDDKRIIAESKSLFDATIAWEVKKKILFLLGEYATPESFKILKKYLDDSKTIRKDWAMLALQELQFHVENKLYDEGRDMIMSALGGKGDMTRYYVVVSKKKNEPLTSEEKKVLTDKAKEIAQKKKSEVEDIEFETSSMLIKILISIHIAPQEVIDAFLDAGSTEMNILRYHFFITNTHKPTKKEIQEYLQMDEVKKL